ncbi:hypothetical protein TNCV_3343111 [Trichonephila clavipes]|uniref:Uncharacterized protein n=1 Tax=Trichonephila clavipes TaxID=2585209 RepID=A0A8X6WEX0_TRICX|nr:hypothetical protein TNCV_3343111 [Trichonephila clavipes]
MWEPHQTSECEIDRVETMYCVNCEAYGHMANTQNVHYTPKPRKGATIKPNYTTIVNSLVRPNVSFAQAAAQQEKNKNTAPTPQQMAPRIGQVPTTINSTNSGHNNSHCKATKNQSALFHTTGSTTTERPSIKTDSPLLYEMTSLLRTSASPPMSPHQSSCSNHTAKESTAPREPQRTLKTLYYFTQDSKRTHD